MMCKHGLCREEVGDHGYCEKHGGYERQMKNWTRQAEPGTGTLSGQAATDSLQAGAYSAVPLSDNKSKGQAVPHGQGLGHKTKPDRAGRSAKRALRAGQNAAIRAAAKKGKEPDRDDNGEIIPIFTNKGNGGKKKGKKNKDDGKKKDGDENKKGSKKRGK